MVPSGEATLCEYRPGDLSPAVEVHAANIFTDYEHLGFFRIGALPMVVADDVQIKIQSVPYLAKALADIKLWHQGTPASRLLEVRNLEITVRGEKEPRLRAGLARVGKNNTIKLLNVTFRDADGPLSVPNAILRIGGPAAGNLCWNSNGHQKECSLFQAPTDKKP